MVQYTIHLTHNSHLAFWKLSVHLLFVISPTWKACTQHNFFCTLNDGKPQPVLRSLHPYYSQVQGQMAVGDRPWCDFVVYTTVYKESIMTAHFGKVDYCQNRLTFMTIV